MKINSDKRLKLFVMRSLKIYLILFISLSCFCGICSKDDDADPAGDNSTNSQKFNPDSTWVYFEDVPSLDYFYPNNKRQQFEKWVATKIDMAFSMTSSVTGKRYLSWGFENAGDTRFLSNSLNPGGKERLDIFINNISASPGPGSYAMDIDYKQGYCWYDVLTSSGDKYDSTRTQAINNSVINITTMSLVRSLTPTADLYKMSGNATINIMYWQNGTSSTTDIHILQCTFNNVFVHFVK